MSYCLPIDHVTSFDDLFHQVVTYRNKLQDSSAKCFLVHF